MDDVRRQSVVAYSPLELVADFVQDISNHTHLVLDSLDPIRKPADGLRPGFSLGRR